MVDSFHVVFSDEHMLVVNKPTNMSVLPEGWDKSALYLLKLIEMQFGRVWVVHRIDKNTSGVLAFALTAEAHRSLNIQFEKREVEKVYHALINGVPKWEEKTTKFPLRVNVGHKHRTVVDDRNGVRSETRFKLLERYQTAALVEASPMTGRTHQIRVHAYAMGHPLLGDALYSAPKTELISRPALHARSLTLIHPETGKRLSVHADYPSDFETALAIIKNK